METILLDATKNSKYIKHTAMLGLIRNWGKSKLLRDNMAEARMNRSWKEWMLKFCELPLAQKVRLNDHLLSS